MLKCIILSDLWIQGPVPQTINKNKSQFTFQLNFLWAKRIFALLNFEGKLNPQNDKDYKYDFICRSFLNLITFIDFIFIKVVFFIVCGTQHSTGGILSQFFYVGDLCNLTHGKTNLYLNSFYPGFWLLI